MKDQSQTISRLAIVLSLAFPLPPLLLGLSAPLILLAAPFGYLIARLLESELRRGRMLRFEREMQDSLPLFSSALRAGHTIQKCFQLDTRRFPNGNSTGDFTLNMDSIFMHFFTKTAFPDPEQFGRLRLNIICQF